VPATGGRDGPASGRMAMHIHGSASEALPAKAHLDQARQGDVDVIWWTDDFWVPARPPAGGTLRRPGRTGGARLVVVASTEARWPRQADHRQPTARRPIGVLFLHGWDHQRRGVLFQRYCLELDLQRQHRDLSTLHLDVLRAGRAGGDAPAEITCRTTRPGRASRQSVRAALPGQRRHWPAGGRPHGAVDLASTAAVAAVHRRWPTPCVDSGDLVAGDNSLVEARA
jgi:hypothetical protein